MFCVARNLDFNISINCIKSKSKKGMKEKKSDTKINYQDYGLIILIYYGTRCSDATKKEYFSRILK